MENKCSSESSVKGKQRMVVRWIIQFQNELERDVIFALHSNKCKNTRIAEKGVKTGLTIKDRCL